MGNSIRIKLLISLILAVMMFTPLSSSNFYGDTSTKILWSVFSPIKADYDVNIVFSPNGRYIALCSMSKGIALFTINGTLLWYRNETISGMIMGPCVISPDSQYILVRFHSNAWDGVTLLSIVNGSEPMIRNLYLLKKLGAPTLAMWIDSNRILLVYIETIRKEVFDGSWDTIALKTFLVELRDGEVHVDKMHLENISRPFIELNREIEVQAKNLSEALLTKGWFGIYIEDVDSNWYTHIVSLVVSTYISGKRQNISKYIFLFYGLNARLALVVEGDRAYEFKSDSIALDPSGRFLATTSISIADTVDNRIVSEVPYGAEYITWISNDLLLAAKSSEIARVVIFRFLGPGYEPRAVYELDIKRTITPPYLYPIIVFGYDPNNHFLALLIADHLALLDISKTISKIMYLRIPLSPIKEVIPEDRLLPGVKPSIRLTKEVYNYGENVVLIVENVSMTTISHVSYTVYNPLGNEIASGDVNIVNKSLQYIEIVKLPPYPTNNFPVGIYRVHLSFGPWPYGELDLYFALVYNTSKTITMKVVSIVFKDFTTTVTSTKTLCTTITKEKTVRTTITKYMTTTHTKTVTRRLNSSITVTKTLIRNQTYTYTVIMYLNRTIIKPTTNTFWRTVYINKTYTTTVTRPLIHYKTSTKTETVFKTLLKTRTRTMILREPITITLMRTITRTLYTSSYIGAVITPYSLGIAILMLISSVLIARKIVGK